ncbi:AMP-binding protein [Neotamlana laminarinivorans]|uniref:AMP-binding protein n=1 Tax=Neotamlana laminarinivorans TaxID=2883124 RepID=A0A9X1L2H1_9FLAO|nr:AMP-binding protein [Tamlana laminarinivorans]MCB4797579.1 AMP-binding protein [Tamlana laminarinivorans]
MTPTYKNVHLKFKLDGLSYKYDDLMEIAYNYVKEGYPFQQELGEFLLDWLDQHDYVEVNTSGSTGKPKKLKIKKAAMINSALATGDFFGLQPGDKVLNCLPSNFIAGKMMMVRAIILGLEIDMLAPTSKPVIDFDKPYDFCAFTPMQLKSFDTYINNIKTIIVGGGMVSKSIIESIQDKKANIYETYGMTETVTHIAVKKLNHIKNPLTDNYFKTLPNVTVQTDDRSCLVINAPKIASEKIITNDIVKIHSENSFEWLGRFDNVINSGGIKLYPEQIEKKLQSKIKEEFFVASIPDDTLGEKLILLIETGNKDFDTSVFDVLDKYEKPKEVITLPKFIQTASGKIHRQKTLELA